MDLMRAANLALRFLLELGALAAAAYWGATGDGGRGLRVLLAVAGPVVVGVVWILFVAPGAMVYAAPVVRFLVELGVFGAAVMGLLRRGRSVLAVVLGFAYTINRTLMAVWDQ